MAQCGSQPDAHTANVHVSTGILQGNGGHGAREPIGALVRIYAQKSSHPLAGVATRPHRVLGSSFKLHLKEERIAFHSPQV